jgi:hypothetical protein
MQAPVAETPPAARASGGGSDGRIGRNTRNPELLEEIVAVVVEPTEVARLSAWAPSPRSGSHPERSRANVPRWTPDAAGETSC